jgi:hypothetical protein
MCYNNVQKGVTAEAEGGSQGTAACVCVQTLLSRV